MQLIIIIINIIIIIIIIIKSMGYLLDDQRATL